MHAANTMNRNMNDVVFLALLCYNGVNDVLQWRYCGVTVVFMWCYWCV
jgi:hypothetical protein